MATYGNWGPRSHDAGWHGADDQTMETTTETHIDERATGRLRRAITRLALATAVSSTALVIASQAAHARIAVNHNESAGRDRPRRSARRAVAALALAAAATVPAAAAAATAAPASAAGCSSFWCGSDGNHNESAGMDRP